MVARGNGDPVSSRSAKGRDTLERAAAAASSAFGASPLTRRWHSPKVLAWAFGGCTAAVLAWGLWSGNHKSHEIVLLKAQLAEQKARASELQQRLSQPPTPLAKAPDAKALAQTTAKQVELETQLATLQAERVQAHDKLTAVTAQRDTAATQRDQLQQALASLQRERDQLSQRIGQLETEHAQALQQLNTTLAGKERDLAQQQQQIALLTQLRTNLERDLTTAKQDLQNAGATAAEARDELRQKLAGAEQERAQLAQRIDQLQAEHTQTRQQLGNTLTTEQQDRAQLAEQRAGLERDLAAARAELAALRQRDLSTRADVARLHEDLRLAKLNAKDHAEFVTKVADKLEVDWSKPAGDGAQSAPITILHKLDEVLAVRTAGPGAAQPAAMPVVASRSIPTSAGAARPAQATAAAPEPAPPSASESALQEIHFSSNSADLTPGAKRKTQLAATAFQNKNLNKIRILGFSDTIGDHAHNLLLSKRRASAVADWLVKSGVPRDKIEVIGKGESDLPEQTPDEMDEPLNRCVGIIGVN